MGGGGQLLSAACVNTRLPPCCIGIKALTVTEETVPLMRVKTGTLALNPDDVVLA